jgi:hypothetical protein
LPRAGRDGKVAAASDGAQWIVTPEFCVSGFTFADRIGTEWIREQPDPWMAGFRRRVADLGVTVFLSHPERDARTGALHNSVFVIGPDGAILGTHRKINTLRVGSEAWSTPGDEVAAIEVAPLGRVGVLACADASSPWIAKSLAAQGARLLVSSAAWAPGVHGPNGVGAVHARHRPAARGLQPHRPRRDHELRRGGERGRRGRAEAPVAALGALGHLRDRLGRRGPAPGRRARPANRSVTQRSTGMVRDGRPGGE